MALAILGVTGYTGRLVLAEARRAGLEVRLVGRRREALEELAAPGEEVRVADARDESALRDAFEGVSVVASCAGPFLEIGLAPVAAAVGAGAHYLDTTGEQEFVRLIHDRIEPDDGGAARVRLRLRARRPRRTAGGRAGRRPAGRGRRRVLDERRRHEPRHAAARSAASCGSGRSPGRTAGSSTPASARRRARSASRSASAPSSSGAAPSRSPSRGTPTSATCAPTSGLREWRRKAGGLSWLTAPLVQDRVSLRPVGPVGGLPAQEPLRGRRRGARPGRRRARRRHRQRRLRPDRAPDRPRRAGADRRRGERNAACSRRRRRSTPARSPAGSSRSSRSMRVNAVRSASYGESRATAQSVERGRVLRPVLRVAGRGRREGLERRADVTRGTRRPSPASCSGPCSKTSSTRANLKPLSDVPDVLAPGLTAVFCGINPGRFSAAANAHFANPRNDFWRLLHAAGFTPRLYDPSEQFELLQLGLGVTNAALPDDARLRRPPPRRLRRLGRAAGADRAGAEAGRDRLRRQGGVPRRVRRARRSSARRSAASARRRSGCSRRRSPANAAVPWAERLRWFRAFRESL